LEEGESLGVGPGSFYKETGVFCPWGAEKWNDDYCFMPIGVKP
jgi:hypothetical protein